MHARGSATKQQDRCGVVGGCVCAFRCRTTPSPCGTPTCPREPRRSRVSPASNLLQHAPQANPTRCFAPSRWARELSVCRMRVAPLLAVPAPPPAVAAAPSGIPRKVRCVARPASWPPQGPPGTRTRANTPQQARRRAASRWSLTRPLCRRARVRTQVVYLPSCVTRMMGPAASDKETASVHEKLLSIFAKAGYEVRHLPPSPSSRHLACLPPLRGAPSGVLIPSACAANGRPA